MKNLSNKKVLITAGPTWAPIDSVRVIANTATGETGVLLAKALQQAGARVTLLLGPVAGGGLRCKKVRLIRFAFFEELKESLLKELKAKEYDIVIHSAAVADYLPDPVTRGKIESGLKGLCVRLTPAPKIINLIKELRGDIKLVGFKYEPAAAGKKLITEAVALRKRSGAEAVVANTVSAGGRYSAHLVEKGGTQGPFFSKPQLVKGIVRYLSAH